MAIKKKSHGGQFNFDAGFVDLTIDLYTEAIFDYQEDKPQQLRSKMTVPEFAAFLLAVMQADGLL